MQFLLFGGLGPFTRAPVPDAWPTAATQDEEKLRGRVKNKVCRLCTVRSVFSACETEYPTRSNTGYVYRPAARSCPPPRWPALPPLCTAKPTPAYVPPARLLDGSALIRHK